VIITPARRVFAAVVDALGFTGDGALTKIDLNKAIPTYGLGASVEAAQVRYSEFIRLRTNAGAVNASVDIDPHVLGDWTEIRNRGRTLVAIAGSEVPATHDAWIIHCGQQITVAAALDLSHIFREAPTVGIGAARSPLWLGDTATPDELIILKGATFGDPILSPLPWWIPPVAEQVDTLRWRLDANAAQSTNLVLGILSAPPGVLRRLY